MKKIVVAVLLLCLSFAAITPAIAHGGSKIVRHRLIRLDGAVRVKGVYRLTKPHSHIFIAVFIIQGEHVIAEKTARGSGQRIVISLRTDCRRPGPVYAVIQGDTADGGHFAKWNTRKVVCERSR